MEQVINDVLSKIQRLGIGIKKAELEGVIEQLTINTLDKSDVDELLGYMFLHEDAVVRTAAINLLTNQGGYDEYLLWALHDPVESVSFSAMQGCVDNTEFTHFEALAVELNRILGSVGVGETSAATTNKEIMALYALERLERKVSHAKLTVIDADARPSGNSDPGEMIFIPGGPCVVGDDTHDYQYFSTELVPDINERYVSDFYIDTYPVTNMEYDEFCEVIKEHGHLWCHPDETPGKNHTRSTFGDDCFKPDHPVVGVDWYDAFAYLAWRGKNCLQLFNGKNLPEVPRG